MTTPISANLQQVFENYPSIQFCKSKDKKASKLKVGMVQSPENPQFFKDVYVHVSDAQIDNSPLSVLFIKIFSLQLQKIPPQYFEKFILYLAHSKKFQLEKKDLDLLLQCCQRSDLNTLSPAALYCLMELFERAEEARIPHLESILTKEKLEEIVKHGKSAIKHYRMNKNLQKLTNLSSSERLEKENDIKEEVNHTFRIHLYSLINHVGKFSNVQNRDELLEYLFSIFKDEEDCFYFFPDAMRNKPLHYFENFIKNLFYTPQVILENEDIGVIAEYCKTCNLAALSNSTLYSLIQLFEIDGKEVIPNLESILTEEKLKAIVREGKFMLSQKLRKDFVDPQFRVNHYSMINQVGKFSDPSKRDPLLACLFSILDDEEDIIDYLLSTEEEDSISIEADDSYNSRASSYSYELMDDDSSDLSGESDVFSYGSSGLVEDIESEEIEYEEPFIETALVNVLRASQNPENPLFSRALNAIVDTLNHLSKERTDSLKLILIHSITDVQRKYLIEKHRDVFF